MDHSAANHVIATTMQHVTTSLESARVHRDGSAPNVM